MTRTSRILLGALALLGAAPALAVGYEPVHFDRKDATEYYGQLRFLLSHDFDCPRGQVPVSGLMTGGDSGLTGVYRTVITFDKGATVKVVQNWSTLTPKKSVTVEISCTN